MEEGRGERRRTGRSKGGVGGAKERGVESWNERKY